MHSSSMPILQNTVINSHENPFNSALDDLLLIAHRHVVVSDERDIFVPRAPFKTDDLQNINDACKI